MADLFWWLLITTKSGRRQEVSQFSSGLQVLLTQTQDPGHPGELAGHGPSGAIDAVFPARRLPSRLASLPVARRDVRGDELRRRPSPALPRAQGFLGMQEVAREETAQDLFRCQAIPQLARGRRQAWQV